MSRLDKNTCQTSIKTDILFGAAVTHPGSIGRTQDYQLHHRGDRAEKIKITTTVKYSSTEW